MRIVVAILSAALVLTATWFYQLTLAENQFPEHVEDQASTAENYRLRILATFDAGVDPFAEDVSKAASLTVSYQGKSFFTVHKSIAAGETVETELELELRQGQNEFLVEMSPANTSEEIPKAIHVELFRGNGLQPIETQTIWATANDGLVIGRVPFDVPVRRSLEE